MTATRPVIVPKNSTILILYPQSSTSVLLMLKKSVILWQRNERNASVHFGTTKVLFTSRNHKYVVESIFYANNLYINLILQLPC